jgi:hypothetical protein
MKATTIAFGLVRAQVCAHKAWQPCRCDAPVWRTQQHERDSNCSSNARAALTDHDPPPAPRRCAQLVLALQLAPRCQVSASRRFQRLLLEEDTMPRSSGFHKDATNEDMEHLFKWAARLRAAWLQPLLLPHRHRHLHASPLRPWRPPTRLPPPPAPAGRAFTWTWSCGRSAPSPWPRSSKRCARRGTAATCLAAETPPRWSSSTTTGAARRRGGGELAGCCWLAVAGWLSLAGCRWLAVAGWLAGWPAG